MAILGGSNVQRSINVFECLSTSDPVNKLQFVGDRGDRGPYCLVAVKITAYDTSFSNAYRYGPVNEIVEDKEMKSVMYNAR